MFTQEKIRKYIYHGRPYCRLPCSENFRCGGRDGDVGDACKDCDSRAPAPEHGTVISFPHSHRTTWLPYKPNRSKVLAARLLRLQNNRSWIPWIPHIPGIPRSLTRICPENITFRAEITKLHTNAPFRKISNSAKCGRFALILWRLVNGSFTWQYNHNLLD